MRLNDIPIVELSSGLTPGAYVRQSFRRRLHPTLFRIFALHLLLGVGFVVLVQFTGVFVAITALGMGIAVLRTLAQRVSPRWVRGAELSAETLQVPVVIRQAMPPSMSGGLLPNTAMHSMSISPVILKPLKRGSSP